MLHLFLLVYLQELLLLVLLQLSLLQQVGVSWTASSAVLSLRMDYHALPPLNQPDHRSRLSTIRVFGLLAAGLTGFNSLRVLKTQGTDAGFSDAYRDSFRPRESYGDIMVLPGAPLAVASGWGRGPACVFVYTAAGQSLLAKAGQNEVQEAHLYGAVRDAELAVRTGRTEDVLTGKLVCSSSVDLRVADQLHGLQAETDVLRDVAKVVLQNGEARQAYWYFRDLPASVRALKTHASPAAKRPLLDLLARLPPNGIGVSNATRAQVMGLIKALERENPELEPGFSVLQRGMWKMLYSDVSGPSSGQLGPFKGEVFQQLIPVLTPGSKAGEIRNILKVRLPPFAGCLTANQTVLDTCTWRIEFYNVVNAIFGKRFMNKYFPPNTVRLWRYTYLDLSDRPEDRALRVIRAWDPDNGSFEDSFVFVTQRV
eukprot:g1031.t1